MRKIDSLIVLALAVIILVIAPCRSSQAQHYTEENGWFIDNWSDPELSWDIYRSSFMGIPPNYDPAASALDVAFYDLVFKSELSANGNCFGMSVMALMMISKGGYLGFCLPVPQYSGDLYSGGGPTDSDLRRAVNQMHGHQVGTNALNFIVAIFANGKNRDGNYAYDQFDYYKMKDDPTVVSITKSVSPVDGGHTMVSYDAREVSGQRRIYVYDPNRSWADSAKRTWYESGSNYIGINKTSGSWSFMMADATTWSGSPSSGGNVIIQPLSVVGPLDRSPASLGMNAISSFLSTYFISGNGADLIQITNSEGKRMYKPGTKDLDINPATGMLNTIPWFPSDQRSRDRRGQSREQKVIYFMLGNSYDALDIDVRNGRNGYHVGMIGGVSFLSVRAYGGGRQETITLENAGSKKPAVILRNQVGAARYDVQFHQILEPYKRSRTFNLTNLELSPGAPVIIRVADEQQAIEVSTTRSGVQYDLELVNVIGKESTTLRRERLQTSANQRQLIQPQNWQALRADELQIRQDAIIIDPDRLERIPQRRIQK